MGAGDGKAACADHVAGGDLVGGVAGGEAGGDGDAGDAFGQRREPRSQRRPVEGGHLAARMVVAAGDAPAAGCTRTVSGSVVAAPVWGASGPIGSGVFALR